jgi:hypothetical protein
MTMLSYSTLGIPRLKLKLLLEASSKKFGALANTLAQYSAFLADQISDALMTHERNTG